MRKTKLEKGITLVALIITIVVLLILAVVSIGAVKNSGIIGHATNTSAAWEKSKENETLLLTGYELELRKQTLGIWGKRGLATVILDTPYCGNTDGVYYELTVESNGNLKITDGGSNELFYGSEDIDDALAIDDASINDNNTLELGDLELVFSNDGKTVEIIGIGKLFIDYEKEDLTEAKVRVYMSNDGKYGYLFDENGDWYIINNGSAGKLGLNCRIDKDVTITVGGNEKKYKYLFWANTVGNEDKYLYYGEFSNDGITFTYWSVNGSSDDGKTYDKITKLNSFTLDRSKSKADFTMSE